MQKSIIQIVSTDSPSLTSSSRGILFSVVPVSVEKLLLKKSRASCSGNYLISIHFLYFSLLNPLTNIFPKC